jgi:hypothetical protein
VEVEVPESGGGRVVPLVDVAAEGAAAEEA